MDLMSLVRVREMVVPSIWGPVRLLTAGSLFRSFRYFSAWAFP
jgi:hypothetical protein